MEKNISLGNGKCWGAYHHTLYYGHDGPVNVSCFTEGEKIVGVNCPFRDEKQLCQAYKAHSRLGGLFNRIYLFSKALEILSAPSAYVPLGAHLRELWKPQVRNCDPTLIRIKK